MILITKSSVRHSRRESRVGDSHRRSPGAGGRGGCGGFGSVKPFGSVRPFGSLSNVGLCGTDIFSQPRAVRSSPAGQGLSAARSQRPSLNISPAGQVVDRFSQPRGVMISPGGQLEIGTQRPSLNSSPGGQLEIGTQRPSLNISPGGQGVSAARSQRPSLNISPGGQIVVDGISQPRGVTIEPGGQQVPCCGVMIWPVGQVTHLTPAPAHIGRRLLSLRAGRRGWARICPQARSAPSGMSAPARNYIRGLAPLLADAPVTYCAEPVDVRSDIH